MSQAHEPMSVAVKICGLTDPRSVRAAVEAGADFLGFNFHEESPRHLPVSCAHTLRALAGRARAVALTADAGDALLAEIVAAVRPDLLQLHGAESPERTGEIAARFRTPVIKALPVRGAGDLARAEAYRAGAAMILFDAAPSAPGRSFGGQGRVFDWSLLAGRSHRPPWILSGGLTPENVAEACAISGARIVDVSSGVERGRGRKDPQLIARFVRAAKAARESRCR